MAIKTFGAVAGNWSDDTKWVGGAKPAAADVALFDATSAACTVDEATAALGGLTMTGYAATLTVNSATTDIDVNGNVDLDGAIALGAASGDIYCSGNFTKTAGMTALPAGLKAILDGTGTLTCNAVSGGALDINTAGTITAGSNQLWSSFLLTGGTFSTGGTYSHTIVGDIIRTAGTCTTAGNWTQTGTGTLKWQDTAGSQYPGTWTFNGTGTITTGTNLSCQRVAGSGTITDGGGTGALYFPGLLDNFWTFTGTCSAPVIINATISGLTTGSAITLQGKNFTMINASGANPVLLDGHLNLQGAAATAGNLLLSATSGVVKLDTGNYSVTASNITMGHATNAVTLDLGGGTHYISGTVAATAGTPTLNFGQSKIKLAIGAAIDGTSITATADAATNPPASVVGGTVRDVIYEAGKILDCSGGYTKDGGGNTTGEFWFGSSAERWHPAAIRERSWGFFAGTRR